MQLAMVGLGRMGGNMVERLMRHGHTLVVYDRSDEAMAKYEKLGAKRSADLAALVRALEKPPS
jgi:6-phosphogluconate dehydrogenase